jgi:hypothetical protein
MTFKFHPEAEKEFLKAIDYEECKKTGHLLFEMFVRQIHEI